MPCICGNILTAIVRNLTEIAHVGVVERKRGEAQPHRGFAVSLCPCRFGFPKKTGRLLDCVSSWPAGGMPPVYFQRREQPGKVPGIFDLTAEEDRFSDVRQIGCNGETLRRFTRIQFEMKDLRSE